MYYALRPAGASKWFSIDGDWTPPTRTRMSIRGWQSINRANRICACQFGRLLYITLTNQQWVKQQIDPGSGTISYHCSIAVTPDGAPHVGWYHEFLPGGAQYSHFRHADLENGVWMVRSVDGGIAGKWSSMVVDSKGFPHATYSQFAHGGDLDYAEWDGNNWNLTTVDSIRERDSIQGL